MMMVFEQIGNINNFDSWHERRLVYKQKKKEDSTESILKIESFWVFREIEFEPKQLNKDKKNTIFFEKNQTVCYSTLFFLIEIYF